MKTSSEHPAVQPESVKALTVMTSLIDMYGAEGLVRESTNALTDMIALVRDSNALTFDMVEDSLGFLSVLIDNFRQLTED